MTTKLHIHRPPVRATDVELQKLFEGAGRLTFRFQLSAQCVQQIAHAEHFQPHGEESLNSPLSLNQEE